MPYSTPSGRFSIKNKAKRAKKVRIPFPVLTLLLCAVFNPFVPTASATPIPTMANSSETTQQTIANNEALSYNILTSEKRQPAAPSASFPSEARNAFLRLQSRPYIEPPLLPDEERRQIWLERHRHNHIKKEESMKGRF